MDNVRPDRLRALLDPVLGALDERLDGWQLAGRAHLSRFHFDRLLSAGLGEAPGAFRRRLLLERAAWRLSRGTSVTEAGFEAAYDSTEAFSRAFRRAYGTAPSGFAASAGDFRLPAPNGVHFHPPAGLLVTGEASETPMDLTDRLMDHDHWLTGRLLDSAGRLTDGQLDREVRPGHTVLAFDGAEPTARRMLDRLIWTKEVWSAAIAGRDMPAEGERSLDGLRRRWERSGAEFRALAYDIRKRHAWDDVFVDALCDPPQSFTLGGVIAHVLTFAAHRRQVLAGVLSELGVEDVPPTCPMEWERVRLAERPHPPTRLRGGEAR
ncbi:helix-turn-helix transcriptional regulator [Nonomuraea sp. MCN248]|uniref:Helix-turn-helix transcriptional regulator n=1 Tax=Nonomuraea corallina TaxID=2989783 RepID=A0ABT4SM13_9ACTN|nr:helix-turn-helix transcriptional regulator [Nonomuraea corallina]MDA0638281.1 helix-turn-helix transcriptional regulator [Nonomuraea corallina]